MSDTAQERKRGAYCRQYPQRLPVYGSREDLELLRRLAARMGISMAGVVRHLIREKAREEGLEP